MFSIKRLAILGGSLCFAGSVFCADAFDPETYAAKDVITRDVAVVGGGASGTYAAINLQDMGQSVVMIERAGRLGGQAETYTDPTTGTKVDFGVQAYYNNSVATKFFARLNVPITNYSFASSAVPVYADFTTGAPVTDFTPTRYGADYIAQLNKYPYLNGAYDLPNPVPQDLLLTWPEYIKKYSLEDSAYATLSGLAGSGNPFNSLAIYVFSSINQALIQEGAGAAITTARHDNSELFENALKVLGTNALLNSTVIAANRSKTRTGGVKLVVKTPTGSKLVVAKQLVLGIPPVLQNMQYFGLNTREHGTLSQLHGYPYYAGLVSATGLSVANVYTNIGANTEYHVATVPGSAFFKPTAVRDLFLYWYSALQPMTQAQVQKAASTEVTRLRKITNVTTTAAPDFVAFANHSPFHLTVSAQNISNGFYRDMYALQGYRNTWYIGALFAISSGQLWNNTAQMLPEIIAAAK